MPFTPPSDAQRSAIRPDDGCWTSCGWLALERWRAEQGLAYRPLAEKLGCSAALLSGWKNGRPVSPTYFNRLEALCGIDRDAWTWWVRDEDLEATDCPSSPPPSSGRRKGAPAVDAPPVPFGSTQDELVATVRQIDSALRDVDLSGAQKAGLLGKRTSALTALARLEEQQAIHRHPEAEAFLDDVAQALEDVLGPDLPPGALARLGDRVDELQRRRAASPRKAAA